MDGEVNREAVNDRAKLLMHRIVARRVSRDPSLVADAVRALSRAEARDPGRGYHAEWRSLLALPLAELRRILTRRDERMVWLRLSSPFMVLPGIDLTDPGLRRRIWRLARGRP